MMPLFFFAVGLVLIISGMRGNAQAISTQLFSDAKGFLAFGTTILILGGLGAFPAFRPVSKSLLILVFVVFFLKNSTNVITNIRNDTLGTASTGTSQLMSDNATYDVGGGSSQTASSSGNNDGKYVSMIADLFA